MLDNPLFNHYTVYTNQIKENMKKLLKVLLIVFLTLLSLLILVSCFAGEPSEESQTNRSDKDQAYLDKLYQIAPERADLGSELLLKAGINACGNLKDNPAEQLWVDAESGWLPYTIAAVKAYCNEYQDTLDAWLEDATPSAIDEYITSSYKNEEGYTEEDIQEYVKQTQDNIKSLR